MGAVLNMQEMGAERKMLLLVNPQEDSSNTKFSKNPEKVLH